MAISSELRNLHTVLNALNSEASLPYAANGHAVSPKSLEPHGQAMVLRLICDNLLDLAEQIEALESLPLVPALECLPHRVAAHPPLQ